MSWSRMVPEASARELCFGDLPGGLSDILVDVLADVLIDLLFDKLVDRLVDSDFDCLSTLLKTGVMS